MKDIITNKNLIVGVGLELLAVLGYIPVTRYFYYGGGWPFVQLFFASLYIIGARQIYKSNIHAIWKGVLAFWWVGYIAVRLFIVFIS